MKMKTMIAALLVCVSAALAADDAKVEGDLKTLQGKWTAMVGDNKEIPIKLEVKNDDVTLVVTSPETGDYTMKGKVKLDEKGKPHKTVDWVKFTMPDGQALGDIKGIYEFKDGDLKTCSGQPGEDRPTEFKEGNGPGTTTTFKKVKDKDKDKEKDAK